MPNGNALGVCYLSTNQRNKDETGIIYKKTKNAKTNNKNNHRKRKWTS